MVRPPQVLKKNGEVYACKCSVNFSGVQAVERVPQGNMLSL